MDKEGNGKQSHKIHFPREKLTLDFGRGRTQMQGSGFFREVDSMRWFPRGVLIVAPQRNRADNPFVMIPQA